MEPQIKWKITYFRGGADSYIPMHCEVFHLIPGGSWGTQRPDGISNRLCSVSSLQSPFKVSDQWDMSGKPKKEGTMQVYWSDVWFLLFFFHYSKTVAENWILDQLVNWSFAFHVNSLFTAIVWYDGHHVADTHSRLILYSPLTQEQGLDILFLVYLGQKHILKQDRGNPPFQRDEAENRGTWKCRLSSHLLYA